MERQILSVVLILLLECLAVALVPGTLLSSKRTVNSTSLVINKEFNHEYNTYIHQWSLCMTF
jgi:hypothetical protein